MSLYPHVAFHMTIILLSGCLVPGLLQCLPNILPAPVVLLDKGVFVAPDSVELLRQFGKDFTRFLAAKGFD